MTRGDTTAQFSGACVSQLAVESILPTVLSEHFTRPCGEHFADTARLSRHCHPPLIDDLQSCSSATSPFEHGRRPASITLISRPRH